MSKAKKRKIKEKTEAQTMTRRQMQRKERAERLKKIWNWSV